MSKYTFYCFDLSISDKGYLMSRPRTKSFDTFDELLNYVDEWYFRIDPIDNSVMIFSNTLDELCYATDIQVSITDELVSIQYNTSRSLWLGFKNPPTCFIEFFISKTD